MNLQKFVRRFLLEFKCHPDAKARLSIIVMSVELFLSLNCDTLY